MKLKQISNFLIGNLNADKTGNIRLGVSKNARFLYPVFSFVLILVICLATVFLNKTNSDAATSNPASCTNQPTGITGINYSYDQDTRVFTITGSGTITAATASIYTTYFPSADRNNFRAYVEEIRIISDSEGSIKFPANSQYMFKGCTALKKVTLTSVDTSAMTSAYYMFQGCSSLTDISCLDDMNFSNCTNLALMFAQCSALTEFNTFNNRSDLSNVTNVGGLFYSCSSLTKITAFNGTSTTRLNLSSLNSLNYSSSPTYYLLDGCTSLEEIDMFNYADVSALTTPSITASASKIKLKKIKIYNNSTLYSSISSLANFFNGFTALHDVEAFNGVSFPSLTNASTFLSGCSSLTLTGDDETDSTIKIFRNTTFGKSVTFKQAFQNCTGFVKITSDSEKGNIFEDVDMSHFTDYYFAFNGCTNLEEFELFNDGKTYGITNDQSMFYNCTGLKKVKVFNNVKLPSLVTYTDSLFGGCTSLEEIECYNENEISSSTSLCFNTTKFSSAKTTVKKINAFNNNYITDSTPRFVITFETGGTALNNAFKGYSALCDVKCFNSNTSSNETYNNTFLSVQNTTSTSLKQMFDGCTNLKNVEIFNNVLFAKLADVSGMFANCSSLSDYDFLYDIDFSYVATFTSMFINNLGMTEMDLSWVPNSVNPNVGSNDVNFQRMFDGCYNLETFKWGSCPTEGHSNLAYMFYMSLTPNTSVAAISTPEKGVSQSNLRYVDLTGLHRLKNMQYAFANNTKLLYVNFDKPDETYLNESFAASNFSNAFDYTDLVQIDFATPNYTSYSGNMAINAPIKKIILNQPDGLLGCSQRFIFSKNYLSYRVLDDSNNFLENHYLGAVWSPVTTTNGESRFVLLYDTSRNDIDFVFTYMTAMPIYFDKENLKIYYSDGILDIVTGVKDTRRPKVFEYLGKKVGYLYDDGLFVYENLPSQTGLSNIPGVTKEDLAKITRGAFVFSDFILNTEDIPDYEDYPSLSVDNLFSNMPNLLKVDFGNFLIPADKFYITYATQLIKPFINPETVFTGSNKVNEIIVPYMHSIYTNKIHLPNDRYQYDIFDWYAQKTDGSLYNRYGYLTNTRGDIGYSQSSYTGVSIPGSGNVQPVWIEKLVKGGRTFSKKSVDTGAVFEVTKGPNGEILGDENLKYVWNLGNEDSDKDYESNIYALYFEKNNKGLVVFTGYGDNIRYDEDNLPPWLSTNYGEEHYNIKDKIVEIQFAGFTPTHLDYFFKGIDFTKVAITGFSSASAIYNALYVDLLESASHLYDGTNISEFNYYDIDTSVSSNVLSFKDAENLNDISYMFANMTNLSSTKDLDYFIPDLDGDAFPKLNAEGLFEGDSSLPQIFDLSNLKFKATNTKNMFKGCDNVKSLNISNLDLSELEPYMGSGMFDRSNNLAGPIEEIFLPSDVSTSNKVELVGTSEKSYYLFDSSDVKVGNTKQRYLPKKDGSAIKVKLDEGSFIIMSDNTKIQISEIEDMAFTGDEIKPSVIVTDISNIESPITLTENEDYELRYENNINPGTGSIIITGIGSTYQGSTTKTFKIKNKVDLNNDLDFIFDEIKDRFNLNKITKTYDGTNTVYFDGNNTSSLEFSHSDLSKVPQGTVLTVTGAYEDSNAGSGKVITLSYSFDNENYLAFNAKTNTSGEILKKKVSVLSASVSAKTYDGTNIATITNTALDLSKILPADSGSVTLDGNLIGHFTDKSAGLNKSVTVDKTVPYVLSNSNYEVDLDLLDNLNLKGTINKKELQYSLSSLNKEYDGTNTKEVAGTITSGIVTIDSFVDDVKINNPLTLTYSDITSGVYTKGDPVSSLTLSEITLGGLSAGNYFVTQPQTLTGEITGRDINDLAITVTGPSDVEYSARPISLPGSSELQIYDSIKSKYLTLGTDFEIRFKENSYTDAGDVKIIIKGLGNYFGERTYTYRITKKKLTLSMIQIPSEINSSDNVKVKDGTDKDTSDQTIFPGSELVPFVNFNGEIVKFNFDKAFISDALGNPIFAAGERDSNKTLRCIAITKLRIKENDSSFNPANYILVEDLTKNESYTNTSPYIFNGYGYLIDDVSPTVERFLLKNQDTVKTYGEGQEFSFNVYLSEELDIDRSLMSNYYNNVKLTYTVTSGGNSLNFDVNLTDVNDIDSSVKSSRKTVLTFTGTIPTLGANIYEFTECELKDPNNLLCDFAGNNLELDLINSDFTKKYDFSGIRIDQTGFTINITKDVNESQTANKDVTFTIDLSGKTLDARFDTNEKILENFYLKICQGEDPTICNTYKLSDVLNGSVLGVTLQVVTNMGKYKVVVDTFQAGLIGLNDIKGKYINVGIDENKLQDYSGNHNIEQIASVLLLRTINDYELSFIQNAINHLVYDDTSNVLLDSTSNEEVLFYEGDVLTILTNKMISSANAFIKFADSLGNTFDSKDKLASDPANANSISLPIVDSITIRDLFTYFDNYSTDLTKKLLVKVNVRKQSNVISDFEKGINDVIAKSDYTLLRNVITNEKDLKLLDENLNILNPSYISLIKSKAQTISTLTGSNTIMLDELARRYQNRKEGVTVRESLDSGSPSSILDNLLEVSNEIKEMEDILNNDYSSDNTEGVIDYMFNSLWIKKLCEDSNINKITNMLNSEKVNENGYLTSSNVSSYEKLDITGLSTRCTNTSEKIKVKANKELNAEKLSSFGTYLKDSLSVSSSEKMISAYNIELVDSQNEEIKFNVDTLKEVLLRIKLPKEYKNTSINVYHVTSDDPLSIVKVDDEDVIVTFLEDELYVLIKANSFSSYILTGSNGTLTVTESGEEAGGYTPDEGIYSLEKISSKDISITVNSGYTAEIYRNGSKVSTFSSNSTYKVTNLDKNSNVRIDIKYVKNPEKPQQDPEPAPSGGGGGGGGGGTSTNKTPSVTYTILGNDLGEMHSAYIKGYSDGTFKPNDMITREEVATICARLHTQFSETFNYTSNSTFTDTENRWSNNYIGFCKLMGLINGYEDGSFHPKSYMTRAELAVLLNNFSRVKNAEVSEDILQKAAFKDIDGRWFEEPVNKLAYLGILNGYSDGTFRGSNYVTRTEVIIVMNKVNKRNVTKEIPQEYITKVLNMFSDVTQNKWFFKDVAESVIDHPADLY